LGSTIGGQTPATISSNVQILPLPLGGNQGHKKLIQAATAVIKEHCKNPDNLASIADENDSLEKWLIVDYDNMDQHGVDVDTLKQEAQSSGYTLIVNKPNFEFFVLAHFRNLDDIASIRPDQYVNHIGKSVKELNIKNIAERGFTKEMAIPPYSKKLHIANKFFGMLLDYHPELIDKLSSLEVDTTKSQYTEMSVIINRIREIYS
jgi:hypothetical protein